MNIRSAKELHRGCTPECGIYPDVPAELYFSLNAMNHSTLKLMKKSPSHFKFEEAREPGDGARLGTAAHTLLFEPERFKPIPPPINPTTQNPYGSDTKAWAKYEAEHPGALIMSDEEQWSTRELVSAIKAHRTLGPPMTDPSGLNEVTIVWDDEKTGVRCKAKIDRYVPGFGALDLKTVDIAIGAEGGAFARQAINLSYHSAQAFYQRGMKACGFPDLTFVFAVIESSRPFGIKVYEIGEETIKVGRALVSDWLEALAKATKTGEWPGYHDGITTLEAPDWYLKQFFTSMD